MAKRKPGGGASARSKRQRKPAPRPKPGAGSIIGRPLTEVTNDQWKMIEEMARVGCTHDLMADRLGISKRTFYAPHLRERFELVTRMAWATSRYKVLKKQLAMAESGQFVPSIWFGKQHLGQKDKQEHSGDAGQFDRLIGAEERVTALLDKAAALKAKATT